MPPRTRCVSLSLSCLSSPSLFFLREQDLEADRDCTRAQDDLARCILAPEAFLTLQRSLLPQRLQQHDPTGAAAAAAHPNVNANANADADVDMAPIAGPSGALLRNPTDPDVQAAALAGMAAAGRVALEQEQERQGRVA